MALEKKWHYALNKQIPYYGSVGDVSRSTILALKNGLIASGVTFTNQSSEVSVPTGKWTMYQSCDGNTFTPEDDPSDIIGSDPSKLIRGTPGLGHSWFVLKTPLMRTPSFSPGSRFYMIVTCEGSSDQDYWKIFLSKEPPSGGDENNRPTASDEWELTGTTPYMNDNTASSGRTHLVINEDGSFTFLWVKSRVGFPHLSISVHLLMDSVPGDEYPLYCQISYFATTPGALSDKRLWLFFSLWSTTWTATSRTPDGTSTCSVFPAYPVRGNTNSSGYVLFLSDSYSEIIGDGQTRKHPTFPMFVYASVPSTYAYRGRIADLFYGPVYTQPCGALRSPDGGTGAEHVNFSGVWLPTNTAINWS